MRSLAPLVLPLLLASCSNYSFHTNLDKENFTEYFKPGSVTLIDKAQAAFDQAADYAVALPEACSKT